MRQTEILIGKILFVCILVSLIILCAGAVLFLWQHGHESMHNSIFLAEPLSFRALNFSTWWMNPSRLLQLGLITVLGGQILRVILTGLLFAQQRAWIFVGMTVFILCIFL